MRRGRRITVRVSEEVYEWLARKAESSGASLSAVAGLGLDELKRQSDSLAMAQGIMAKLDEIKAMLVEKQ